MLRYAPLAALMLCLPARAAAPKPVATITRIDAEGILGREVLGPDGKAIGRIVNVLVDDHGVPRGAVIDFGGFMGVGIRQIAVKWSDLTFPKVGGRADIKLDLSEDQIKDSPAYTDLSQPAAVAETLRPKPKPVEPKAAP